MTAAVPRKLRPVLDGDWWLIGPSPDLKGVLPGAEQWEKQWRDNGCRDEHNAPVDHHIMADPTGTWHLWGCVRATSKGRILYHWTATDIRQSPWRPTGEIIRVDRAVGESCGRGVGVGDSGDEECIQSPFFVWNDGTCYMFYGGGAARRLDKGGKALPEGQQGYLHDSQICLMTSSDGRAWTRLRNPQGGSSLFVGPGPARDPCVVRINDTWHLYYAGTRDNDPDQPVFWCRQSDDLVHWSEPRIVLCEPRHSSHRWGTECPFVAQREGWYYLFQTENYYEARTHAYRSTDPLNFGIDDTSATYVGMFPAAACEFYTMSDGHEYVSSNHAPRLGTQMCRVKWVRDD
jgi:hypothetical protein